MKRSTAITAAATASLAAVAVTTGIALNLGILSRGTAVPAGVALMAEQSPTTDAGTSSTAVTRPRATTTVPQTEYLTIYEDIPAPAGAEVSAIPSAALEPAVPAPGESTAEGDDDISDAGDDISESEGDDISESEGDDPPAATVPSTTTPSSTSVSYRAADAGTITADVSRNTMTVVSTSAASGWTAAVMLSSGPEVSVRFTGPGRTVTWKAHVEDDGVKVELESESEDRT